MTGSKIFLDTSPLIYFLEKNEAFYGTVSKFFSDNMNAEYVTSVATIAEYFLIPYRNGNQDLIGEFDHFISVMQVIIVDINRPIAEKAARIRANYRTFKAMDCLQLATAIISGCDLFLTNDKQLRQFSEISCTTIGDIAAHRV